MSGPIYMQVYEVQQNIENRSVQTGIKFLQKNIGDILRSPTLRKKTKQFGSNIYETKFF